MTTAAIQARAAAEQALNAVAVSGRSSGAGFFDFCSRPLLNVAGDEIHAGQQVAAVVAQEKCHDHWFLAVHRSQ